MDTEQKIDTEQNIDTEKKLPFYKRRFFKIASATILLIATFITLFYFILIRTPYYSAFMIFYSFRFHDLKSFEKYVALDTVYADAYEQIKAETLDPDTSAGRLAIGIKNFTVKRLTNQLRKQISTVKKKGSGGGSRGARPVKYKWHNESPKKKHIDFRRISAFDVLELGKMPEETEQAFFDRYFNFNYVRFKDVTAVEKEDDSVVLTCILHDLQLDKDLKIDIRMVPRNGGEYWQAVAITNAMDIVMQRYKLVSMAIYENNEEVFNQMYKYFMPQKIDVKLIRGKDYFSWNKIHYEAAYTLPDASKQINQAQVLVLVYNKDGRIAQRAIHYIDDIAAKYDSPDFSTDKVYTHTWDRYDQVGYILNREKGLLYKGGDDYTVEYFPIKLFFTDGTHLKCDLDLPVPEKK